MNVIEVLIPIEISEREADVFRKMREGGCFTIYNGSVTLHFDGQGILTMIDRHLVQRFKVDNLA